MPLHLRELRKGTRFMLMRTGDKFVYYERAGTQIQEVTE